MSIYTKELHVQTFIGPIEIMPVNLPANLEIRQQIWKTQQWPQDWKRSVIIPIPKKGNAKECSNYRTIALISHDSKVMLIVLQAMLKQYVNHKLENSERYGHTRPVYLLLEKSVCRSGSNSYDWTWNNRLVLNRKRSTSRLYTLLI